MKSLYASLNREWKSTYFHKTWTSNLYGQDWDRLFLMGKVKNDFCAICGNSELISRYYRVPAYSQYKVQIPYCDDCFNQATGNETSSKMENLFIIPQKDCGIIASIENKIILKHGTVDIPYKSKSVVTDNQCVVSICIETNELKINLLNGKLIKVYNDLDFRCIAKKGNIIYLGGRYQKEIFHSHELFSILNLNNPELPSLRHKEIPIDFKYGKSIDDILIVNNKLTLVDNIEFPKYLFEYDITRPHIPLYTKTIELENNGTYEHIIKGDINKDWLVLFSKTAAMHGKSSFINISGKTTGRLDFHKMTDYYQDRFPEDLLEIDKYDYKDFCLVENNLVILREDGLFILDLNGIISKLNFKKINTVKEKFDKLIKTPCNRILAVKDVDYELIN